jgi:hypothetical protein
MAPSLMVAPGRPFVHLASCSLSALRDVYMDRTVLQLSAICLLACLCLALAWAHEADYFAMFFAAAAAISGEEAIRRSL